MTETDIDDSIMQILQAPVTEERPWMVFAACRNEDPDLWFSQVSDDVAHALAVCSTCTVRDECLDYSVEARERFGIWGGKTEKQRRGRRKAS